MDIMLGSIECIQQATSGLIASFDIVTGKIVLPTLGPTCQKGL